MSAYPCTSCGACCRRAGLIKGFPHPVHPDGTCTKLVNNRCSIYDTRPAVCRINVGRIAFGLSEERYLALSIQACNAMQEADGMPESFRVKSV